MYLEHFGLSEPPFRITPVTDFFFSGASRGEILDALIYSVCEVEGIVKVSGEVGSGKTMLCRMLLEKLPANIETIYLANPSLSREEMLYAIADGLGLDLDGQRVNIIMQTLQNLLEQKFKDGRRVVVLVDEAHAMPLETLEELRLLYNLQVGDHKLLQIVLFGQPELNTKLDQPNMRQLKDRIVHHFIMLPLSRPAIEAYLMFRMRAAGFRGSNIFSAKALKLITDASQGLLRRINVLADKALLAAFIEEANTVEARHVQQAIGDSGFAPAASWQQALTATGAAALAALTGIAAWWYFADTPPANASVAHPSTVTPAPVTVPVAAPAPITLPASAPIATAASASTATTTVAQVAASAASDVAPAPTLAMQEQAMPQAPLLEQRLAATTIMLTHLDKNSANIQLFYTPDANPGRVEPFLRRAQRLGQLEDIYVLPVKIKGEKAFRVLYGAYPSVDAARAAMRQLPLRYRRAFAPTLYLPDAAQARP